jgi:putative addiction module component (TIGR02574 family)
MAKRALLDEILRLPPDERLRLVEDIWDSLAQTSGELPVPDWHREELDRRLADRTEQATIAWADVRSRFRRAAG